MATICRHRSTTTRRTVLPVSTLLGAGFLAAVAVPGQAAGEGDEVPGDVPVLVVGSRTNGGGAVVKTFIDPQADGTFQTASSFTPYASSLDDGVRVATGDFDDDGNDELVTATDKGDKVLIWELSSSGVVGAPLCSFNGFPQGTFVATGDIDGNGTDELALSRDAGGPPTVLVRRDANGGGCPQTVTSTFNAYPKARKGGVRIAIGDTNFTGGEELITAPGPDDGSQVKVWTDGNGDGQVNDQPLVESFSAQPPGLRGGLFLAAGPVGSAGGGGAELFISKGGGDKSRVVIRTDADADGVMHDDPAFDTVVPYPDSFVGGARVAAEDSDSSGVFVELLVAPGRVAGAQKVKVFDDDGDAGVLLSDNPLDHQFNAFPSNWKAGAYVALGAVRSGTYPMTGSPVFIPDAGTSTSTIAVPSTAGAIKDLDLELDVAHTFVGDLDVSLTHVPTGTSVVLFTDVGGTDEGMIVRLSDEAGTDIGTADNPSDGPITGQFNPEGAALLSVFDGEDASGRWVLTVTDDAGGDVGSLMSWTMHVTY